MVAVKAGLKAPTPFRFGHSFIRQHLPKIVHTFLGTVCSNSFGHLLTKIILYYLKYIHISNFSIHRNGFVLEGLMNLECNGTA
jgi:hypothetical protein